MNILHRSNAVIKFMLIILAAIIFAMTSQAHQPAKQVVPDAVIIQPVHEVMTLDELIDRNHEAGRLTWEWVEGEAMLRESIREI